MCFDTTVWAIAEIQARVNLKGANPPCRRKKAETRPLPPAFPDTRGEGMSNVNRRKRRPPERREDLPAVLGIRGDRHRWSYVAPCTLGSRGLCVMHFLNPAATRATVSCWSGWPDTEAADGSLTKHLQR